MEIFDLSTPVAGEHPRGTGTGRPSGPNLRDTGDRSVWNSRTGRRSPDELLRNGGARVNFSVSEATRAIDKQ
jgi:hypothetical protein